MKLAYLLRVKPRVFADNQPLKLHIPHREREVIAVKPYRNFFHDYLAVKDSDNLGVFDLDIIQIKPDGENIEIYLKRKKE